jgi:hypothetical protein
LFEIPKRNLVHSCHTSGNDDWIWLGDEEEAKRDKTVAGLWFIRSDPRRKPKYPSAEGHDSSFASSRWNFFRLFPPKLNDYSKFASTFMPTFASSVPISDCSSLILESSQMQTRCKLMFNFTAAAVNRLSEHHIRFIRGILKGNGDYVIPGGIYPAMDAFYHKSPIRYMVIYQLCSLQVAEEELFGAYDMYHFRRDILSSDGCVYIDTSDGSSLRDAIDEKMCGIFGFQGYFNGKEDPFMKPNVNAPLYGVEPGSKAHVDYILNVRGQYDPALIAVFGREICANSFDSMRPVREMWPKIAKLMQSMGDEDGEMYPEVDVDDSIFISNDEEDEEDYDSFEWTDDCISDYADCLYDDDDDDGADDDSDNGGCDDAAIDGYSAAANDSDDS